jgi:predicted ATPase/DNA-binding winged helix-turn-helix (wHTH) protein
LDASQESPEPGRSSIANLDGETRFCFGRFTALRDTRRLLLDGQPCEIGSRAFDLLLLLIDCRGRIVSKSEAMDRVWPDIFVDDSNLRVQVNSLRRALGDARDFVKTVPGRGYLFAEDIVVGTQAAEPIQNTEIETPGGSADASGNPPPARRNFSGPLNQTVGRTAELAELDAIVGEARLVTIVGSGGVGKTRIAVELGLRLVDQFPDGVRLVDLAPLADRPAVIGAVATALGVRLQSTDGAVEAIATAIGRQRLLMILDNCEHLVPIIADLADFLLKRAPNLTILATSQRVLRVAAEQVYRLAPLAVPPVGAKELTGFSAVSLLVERAHAADRRFAVTPDNATGIAEICRRLDGVPLALEMAAARLPVLGVEGLRAALDDRLRMLRAGVQTEHARHRTLRAMAEWSEGLLDRAEQHVFRRLAIFAGSVSLEAATAIAGDDGADRWDTVDALSGLVEKSLVAVDSGDPPRYRLLETLRLFARERLQSGDDAEAVAERHARYFAGLFDQAYADWETTPDELWLDIYQPELDNGRTALDWALAQPGRAPIALRLATGLALLLLLLRQYPEGARYSSVALALLNPQAAPVAQGRVFRVASLASPGDFSKTLSFLQKASEQFRRAGDQLGLAWAVRGIGGYSGLLGRFAEADAALAEARMLAASSGCKKISAGVLATMGLVASIRGDHVQARGAYEEALAAVRENRDERMEALVLSNFVMAEFGVGAAARALELSNRSLALDRRFRQRGRGTDTNAISNHASLLIDQDRAAEARPHAEQVFLSCRDLGIVFLRDALLQWVQIGLAEQNVTEAARLWGFISATPIGYPEDADPIFVRGRARAQHLLEMHLSPDDLDSRMREGATWTREQAADFAARHLIWRG